MKTMLISGAVAGLAGMAPLLSDLHKYGDTFPTAIGFTGIAVALLGRNSPAGIAVAALVWAGIERASQNLNSVGVPAGDRPHPAGHAPAHGRHRLRGHAPVPRAADGEGSGGPHRPASTPRHRPRSPAEPSHDLRRAHPRRRRPAVRPAHSADGHRPAQSVRVVLWAFAGFALFSLVRVDLRRAAADERPHLHRHHRRRLTHPVGRPRRPSSASARASSTSASTG